MLRYALVALAVCLALIGAVACGDDDSDCQTAAPGQTAASIQEVCSNVADVQQAAGALRGSTRRTPRRPSPDRRHRSAERGLGAGVGRIRRLERGPGGVLERRRRAQVGRPVGRPGPRRGRIAPAGPCRGGRRCRPGRAGCGRPRPRLPRQRRDHHGVTCPPPADESPGGGRSAGGRGRGFVRGRQQPVVPAGGLIEAGDELVVRAMPALAGAFGRHRPTAAASPGSAQRTTNTDACGPASASTSPKRWASACVCPAFRAAGRRSCRL